MDKINSQLCSWLVMAMPFSSSELRALYAIYNATQGKDWKYETGNLWNFSQPSPDPCSEEWQGISCVTVCSENNTSNTNPASSGNTTTCKNVVSELILVNMHLNGTLPEEIGNFPFMTIFKIYSPPATLYGTLPATVGNLTSLQTLYISYTSMSGTIPSAISALHSLESLILLDCHFTGTIPSVLYDMTNLTVVNLANNFLHGTLSPDLSRLSNLHSLTVELNYFTGSLPVFPFEWSKLEVIDVAGNLLEGTIPSSWANMSSSTLSILSIYSNHLTGSIPTNWSVNSVLSDFPVTLNYLQGEIPDMLLNLSNISSLYLGMNLLSGSIPSVVNPSSRITAIDLSTNCLSGEMPSSIGYLEQLETLSISDNQLTGSIPTTLPFPSELIWVALNDNCLDGSLPVGFGEKFQYLDVSSNFITGNIPDDDFHAEEWQGLLMADNLMSGTIPAGLGNMLDLSYLSLNHNLFYGTVPFELNQLLHLQHLGLGNNMLTGNLLAPLFNATQLYILELDHNHFTGTLDFLLNITKLEFLNITDNFFQGSVVMLTRISSAIVLDISYNLLSGSLPSLAYMASIYTFFAQSNLLGGSMNQFFLNNTINILQAIDVSSNQLTGPLPDNPSTNISSFAAVQNCFAGTIPESFCNLRRLRALALDGLSTAEACRSPILSSVLPQVHSYSLSRGAIHGSIPKCLFGMPALRTLHLSGNGLGGSIPVKEESDLGPYLSDLSLSHNGLSDSLPGPLRGGSRWVSLDVSYNKLKGELQLGEDEDDDNDNDVGSEEAKNSNSNSSDGGGFSPEASVYLNINRLSGRIPGFYYDIGEGSSGSEGDVDMLRGNLFACPQRDLASDVPEADPYRLQYGCGSDDLNSALLVWTGLLFVFGLLLFVVYFVKREKNRRQLEQADKKMSKKSSGGVEARVRVGLGAEEESVEDGGVGYSEVASRVEADGRNVERVCSPSFSLNACDTSSSFSCSSWSEWLHKHLQSYYLFVRLEAWQEDLRLWHQSEWLPSAAPTHPNSVSAGSGVWRSFYSQLVEVSGGNVGSQGHVIEKKRAMLLNILEAGRLLHEVRWCVFWLVIVMVCVGGSVYGSLTVFYGSYDHEYAWTLSAAYLSGVGASSVLVAYFVCLLCASGGMWLQGVRNILLFRSGWRCEVSVPGDGESKSQTVFREGEAGGVGVVAEGGTGVVVEEAAGVTGSPLSQKKGDCEEGSASVDVLRMDQWKGGMDISANAERDEPNPQRKQKLDWCALLAMKVCIAVVNITIVMVVNGFYVYIYLQLQRWSAMMLSVALSVFKVCWSMVVQVGVVKLLQPLQYHEEEEEEGGEERSVEEGGRGDRSLSREGLHEENVRFMSNLMLFNTIVAPCLATMVASSDCFYYVFASPNTITASYSIDICTKFSGLACSRFVTSTHSTDFSPPFSYTYQCSSAMLVDYAYVFAYKYVLIGIFYPLLVLSLVLYVDWRRCKEKATEKKKENEIRVVSVEKMEAGANDRDTYGSSASASLVWVEMFLPVLWRMEGNVGSAVDTRRRVVMAKDRSGGAVSVGTEAGGLSMVDNPLAMSLSSPSSLGNGKDEESKNTRVEGVAAAKMECGSIINTSHSVGASSFPCRPSSLCFSSGDYVIRVTMMVGCLLTFGAVLPYLSILIGFSIASNTYLTQLGWLRMLERCLCKEGVLGKEDVEGIASKEQGGCEGVKAGEGKEVDNEEEKVCEEVEKSVLDQCDLAGDEGGRRDKWQRQGKTMALDKLLELGRECGRMGSSLMRAGQPLLFLVPLFYAGYVFDPAGDEGGWLWGLYLVLSLLGSVLLMVLILLGGGLWRRWLVL